jgi:hypothetical protein
MEVTYMGKFDTVLNDVLNAMQLKDDNLCCAVYWDDICADNAIVMFMEYGGYGTMHAVMKDLHAKLSSRMGHPVSICHNHPTDENVLIHSASMDASVYYSDACCMQSTLGCYSDWVDGGRNPNCYRPELRSLFNAAELLAECLNKTPEYILKSLDWDKDPQAQMIQLLIDYNN